MVIPVFVVKILAVIEGSLFLDFCSFFAPFWYKWPTYFNGNFVKLTEMTELDAIYLRLKYLIDTTSGSMSNIPKIGHFERFFRPVSTLRTIASGQLAAQIFNCDVVLPR